MFQTVFFEIFANLRPSKKPSLICSLHLFHPFLCSPITSFFAGRGEEGEEEEEMSLVRKGVKIKSTVVSKQPLLHPSTRPPVNTISPMSEMTSHQQQCNATKYSLIAQKKTLSKKSVLCRQSLYDLPYCIYTLLLHSSTKVLSEKNNNNKLEYSPSL